MRKSAFGRKGAGKKKKKKLRKNADLGAPALGLGLLDNFRAANIGGGTSGRITVRPLNLVAPEDELGLIYVLSLSFSARF